MSINITGSILTPGTKFEIISNYKSGPITNGTVGFISSLHPMSDGAYNDRFVTDYKCVIVRIGKSGKSRLEESVIPLTTTSFIGDNGAVGHIAYTMDKYPRGIKTSTPLDLLTTNSYNFLGWALAYGRYLANICKGYRYKSISFSNSISLPDDKHNFIVQAYGPKIYEQYANDPEATLQRYTALDKRITIINQIREMEARTSKITLYYKLRSIDAHKRVMSSMISLLDGISMKESYVQEFNHAVACHNNKLQDVITNIKKDITSSKMPWPDDAEGKDFWVEEDHPNV